jgi:flagellar biosynthesis protein FliP
MSGGDALLLGAAALVPVALLALTSFVKISVVLSLLRNALGTNDAPSSLVVMGLGLVLSGVVMAPVVRDMVMAAATAATPATPAKARGAGPAPTVPASATATPAGASRGSAGASTAPASSSTSPAPAPMAPAAIDPAQAAKPDPDWRALVPADRQRDVAAALAALGPLREFLARHAAPRDRQAFTELSRSMGHVVDGSELSVVAPAFITSELWRAFAMAIVLLLPFLVVDLVVGLTLTALGATAMSPQTVALPLKLLLFVAVDGWRLLVEALLRGYG